MLFREWTSRNRTDMREELDVQLEAQLDKGMIRPSERPWAACPHFVKKKNGLRSEGCDTNLWSVVTKKYLWSVSHKKVNRTSTFCAKVGQYLTNGIYEFQACSSWNDFRTRLCIGHMCRKISGGTESNRRLPDYLYSQTLYQLSYPRQTPRRNSTTTTTITTVQS